MFCVCSYHYSVQVLSSLALNNLTSGRGMGGGGGIWKTGVSEATILVEMPPIGPGRRLAKRDGEHLSEMETTWRAWQEAPLIKAGRPCAKGSPQWLGLLRGGGRSWEV